MDTILVDTGILYAIADCDDAWHERVKTFLESGASRLLVPVSVIPEACYLLNTYIGAEAEKSLLEGFIREEMHLEPIGTAEIRRALQVMERYADANIGFVDASIVAVAERRKVKRLLTTDRRHFSMIRPKHCASFELLP